MLCTFYLAVFCRKSWISKGDLGVSPNEEPQNPASSRLKYLPGPFEGLQRVAYFGGTPVSSISGVTHYTILLGFLTVTCLGYSWASMEIQVIDTSVILVPSLAFTCCLRKQFKLKRTILQVCQRNIPGRASCPSGGCYNATISTMQVLLAGWPSQTYRKVRLSLISLPQLCLLAQEEEEEGPTGTCTSHSWAVPSYYIGKAATSCEEAEKDPGASSTNLEGASTEDLGWKLLTHRTTWD